LKTLDSKVGVVTGGASGIGAAITERFAAKGASVALFDQNTEGAQNVLKQIALPGRAIATGGDASCEADVQHAVQQVVDQYSHVDILVDNAGTEQTGSVVEMC